MLVASACWHSSLLLQGQEPSEIAPPIPKMEPQDLDDIPTIVRIEVDPDELNLTDSNRGQQLEVTGFSDQEEPFDLTDQASYELTVPGIARVSIGGFVQAESDGETELRITYRSEVSTKDALQLVVPVQVSGIPKGRIHVNQIGTAGGLSGFTFDRWGLLLVDISNTTSEPVRLLVTSTFEVDTTVQFGRRFTVLAKSKRQVSYPIRIPSYEKLEKLLGKEKERDEGAPRKALTLNVRSFLYNGWGKDKTLIPVRSISGQRYKTTQIRCDPEKPLSGVLSELDPLAKQRELDRLIKGSLTEDPPDPSVHLLQAIRRDQGLGNITYNLQFRAPPASAAGLNATDQLIIAGNRLLDDTAGLLAVRDWLYGGGRLWIMLDKTGTELPSRLLGDQFNIHLVDEVSLQQLAISEEGEDLEPLIRHFDEPGIQPVTLSRVLLDGQQVSHRVGDWPVACWQNVGQGEVLFTMLSMDAWVRPKTVGDGVNVTRPLKSLAERFLQKRQPGVLGQEKLRSFVAEQIGYSIISRLHVSIVLVVLCLALILCGLHYHRREQLERLALAGPLMALLAATYLGVLGAKSRYSVPSMAAEVQWVEADPVTKQVFVSGIAAVYNQAPSVTRMNATQGGIFWPDLEGLEGLSARMIWDDLGRWHWEELRFPDGVRQMPFSTTITLDAPLMVTCTFGPQGLQGDLSLGPFSRLSDALIVTPGGKHLGVTIENNRIVDSVPLPRGRYFQDSLLSDSQQHRAEIYRQLLNPDTEDDQLRPFPRTQMLIGWASAIDVGFRFPDQEDRVDMALLAIPLSIEETPLGEVFQIPSALLDFRVVAGPGQNAASAVYDNYREEWIEGFTRGKSTWLRFQLPSAVLPAEIDQVVVTIDVDAVGRGLNIYGRQGQEISRLAQTSGPQGVVTFELDKTNFMQPDEDGAVWVGLEITNMLNSVAGRDAASWTIKNVDFNIKAGRRQALSD